jgi:protein JBTS26
VIKKAKKERQPRFVRGRKIEMDISESWGDMFYVGLNGIELIDDAGELIPVDAKNLDANPRDMNSIQGHGRDQRTLDKLVNGVNNTTSDENMWLIPYNTGESHTITIDLGRVLKISAVRFYNYNKSPEDSLRGVKQISIKVDGEYVTPPTGISVRKAPGYYLEPVPQLASMIRTDLGQTIPLPYAGGWKAP